jgi:hypothetical protein
MSNCSTYSTYSARSTRATSSIHSTHSTFSTFSTFSSHSINTTVPTYPIDITCEYSVPTEIILNAPHPIVNVGSTYFAQFCDNEDDGMDIQANLNYQQEYEKLDRQIKKFISGNNLESLLDEIPDGAHIKNLLNPQYLIMCENIYHKLVDSKLTIADIADCMHIIETYELATSLTKRALSQKEILLSDGISKESKIIILSITRTHYYIQSLLQNKNDNIQSQCNTNYKHAKMSLSYLEFFPSHTYRIFSATKKTWDVKKNIDRLAAFVNKHNRS